MALACAGTPFQLPGEGSLATVLVAPSAAALDSYLVVGMGLLAIVPLLALAAACADVFRAGSFKLRAGVLYATAAFLILLLSVAAGAIGSIPDLLDAPTGGALGDNIFFLGVGHAAMLAAVIAGIGGIHWWATKIGRQPANEKLGLLAPLVLLLGAAITVEVVLTAIFVLVILGVTHITRGTPALAGLAIGLTLTLIHLVSIPIDNTSVNPARSLATAIYGGTDALAQLWVFLAFPIVGGLIAGFAHRALFERTAL